MGRIVILLAVVFGLAQAGPLKTVPVDGSCAKTCTGNGKLNYEVGKTYRYKYDADVKASIFDAMEDHAGIHLSANVEMAIQSKCELAMKLTDVALTEYDQENKYMKAVESRFKDELEKNPVRLSFQDGAVEELCLVEQEPDYIVNAKRGIISMFQTSMTDFSKNETLKETDVSGTCDTDYYAQESDWFSISFGKSKKLHTCTDRHSLNSAVQGIPYSANSEYQSMPILKSEQVCLYKINKQERYITSVECQEKHMFRPFSRENSGAMTKSDQKLTFIGSTMGISRSGPSMQKVSLKFQHNRDEEGTRSKRDITRKLMEVCEKTKSGVKPETPKMFTELVYMVRAADSDSLNDIYAMLEKGTICKDNNERTSKFFMDALPLAGTGAALNLMTKLLASKSVTGVEADMWLTSLAFIKNPDISVLNEVKPLINMDGNEDKTLLSVGTLIHSYCKHNGNCEEDDTVRALVSAIENKMAPRCKVTDANFRSTLLALRAIGNAGYATSAIPTLELCMKIKSNPMEIQLSAIEAFRRIPCTASRNTLFVILKDIDKDPELRIAAYKAIMECPSEGSLTSIKRILEKEEIKQVGSYIWSHLTNLMETSDRHKQGIKEILEDETFKKEFDLDMMKYSRNYEKSMFIEPINTGAKVEGDLIWSPKSFVPRSSMFNLTVDLFGQSVNLIEFGGRAEGLEYFLEAYMGPNGYHSDAVSKTSQSNSIAIKSVKPDKIKRIDRRFEYKAADLRASLYMRVFGNELKYYNIRGLDDLLSGPDFNILDFMNQMTKDNDVTYSHSTMFLDSRVVIPVGSGFPMSLTVNGTTSIDMKMKGKMDFGNSDIVGLIQPSAAIDISSVMSVDAFVTKCGIRMMSTLHTSTAVQGKIHLSPSETLTAEYEMPQKRMEVFDFKNSFFTIHREAEKEQKMIEENRQTKRLCSPEKIVTVTGLELCTEVSYPDLSLRSTSPYFPLTGPVSGGLYLYNRDTHTKYMLTAKSLKTKASNILHFNFDTPGSKINRHLALNVNLNKKDMALDMTLTSPWKSADLQGQVVTTKRTKGFNGKLNIDNLHSYSIDAKVDMDQNMKTMYQKFTPSLEVRASGMTPIALQANIQTKKLAFMSMDFTMKGVMAEPFEATFEMKNTQKVKSLKGSFEMQENKRYSYESNVAMTSYSKKRLYKPFLSIRTPTAEILALGGNVNHIFGKKIDYKLLLDKVFTKKVSLKGNFRKMTFRRGRVLYGVNTDFRSSPMDFKVNSKIDNRNFRSVSTDVAASYVIRGVSRNSIKLVSKINNLSSSSLTKAKGSLNLNVTRNPEYNLKLMGNIDHNKKLSQVFADISYGADFKDKSKQIELSFEMSRNLRTLMKADADLQTRFRFPAMNLNLVFKGKHSHSDRHLDSIIYLKGGKTFVVESGVHLKDNTKTLLDITGNYTLAYPGHNFMTRNSVEQRNEQTYIFTSEVEPEENDRHTFVTQLTVPATGKSKWNIFSDISIKNSKPVHVEGTFDMNPTDFITEVSFKKALQRYSGSIVSRTTDTESDLILEMEYPERNVVFNINGKNKEDKYSGYADFKWDAANDKKKKVHASFWLEEPTMEKINVSTSLSYPSRDLVFNLLHQVGNKYSTHADFQWEKNKKISADTTLDIKEKSVFCTAKVGTPFTRLPSIDMKLSHNENNEEYLSKLNIGYRKSESVNVELKLKKPLTLKTFVGYFLTTTSMKGMKELRVDVDHKLSPMTEIDSMVKFLWNKQQIQANFELKNTTKAKKVGFMGDLTLKTTYKFMKRGILKLSHSSDGETFNTAGSFQRNKKLYEIRSKITHSPSKLKYDSTGKIDMSCPSGSASMTWDHMLSSNSIKSIANAAWGKKKNEQIGLKVSGNINNMTLVIGLDTPFKLTGNLDVDVGLSKDSLPYSMSLDVTKNRAAIVSVLSFFDSTADNTEGKAALRIPVLDINSRISFKHFLGQREISTEFDITLSPSYLIKMTSMIQTSKDVPYLHSMVFQSSFKNFERIIYSAELVKEHLNILSAKLACGVDVVTELQTSYLMQTGDHRVQFLLKTPFDMMKTLEGGMSIKGSWKKFTAESSIKSIPGLKEKSATLAVDTTTGAIIMAKMDTIFKRIPSINLDLNAQINKYESDVSVSVISEPTQLMSLKMQHNVKSAEKKMFSIMGAILETSYGVSVDHSWRDQEMKSDISIFKDSSKYTGASLKVSYGSKVEGRVVISPPRGRNVEFYLTHDGPLIHLEMKHNRKHHFSFDMELSLSTSSKLNVRSSWQLASICPDGYDSQLMLEFVPKTKVVANGYLTKSSLGKSEFDLLFDVSNNIEGNFLVKSPLMQNIKATFSHFSGQKYFDSKASVVRGGQEMVGGAASLNFDSSVITDVIIRTAVTKKIHASMRLDGKLDNFVIITEASYGKSNANMELSSRVDKNFLQQKLSLTGLEQKDMILELSHFGDLRSFSSFGELNIGRDKHRLDLTFDSKNKLDCSASLETPLVYPMSSRLTLTGTPQNFNGHVEFIRNTERNEINMQFSLNSPKLTGSFDISSPYVTGITMSLTHAASLPQVNSILKLAIDKQGEYEARFSLLTEPSIKSSIIVSTPRDNYEGYVEHQGGLENFKCHGEIKLNSETSELDVQFTSLEKYEGRISLKSPFIPHDIATNFEHTGSMKNFESRMEYLYGSARTKMDVVVNTEKDIFVKMNVKMPKTPKMTGIFRHTGALWNCNTHAEYLHGEDVSFGDLAMTSSDNSVSASFNLKSPHLEDVSMSMKHEGSANDFNSQADFKFDLDSFETGVKFSTLTQYEGKIFLKSTYIPNDISLSFEHKHTSENLRSRFEYLSDMDKSEVNVLVSMAPNLDVSIGIEIPQYQKITGGLTHSGGLQYFNTRGEIGYGNDRSTVDVAARTSNNIVSYSFNLVSPYMDDISMNMKHEGEIRNFVSNANVTVGGRKYEAIAKINIQDDLDTSFQISSQLFDLKFIQSSLPDGFTSSFDMINDMDRYTGDMKVSLGQSVDFDLELTSPVPEFEKVTILYKHTGIPSKFQCHAELGLPDGTSNADLAVDVSNLQDIVLTLMLSPISRFDMKPVKATYKFNIIKDQKMLSVMEFNQGNDENRMEIMVRSSPNLKGHFTVNSVFTPAVKAEFLLTKSSSHFKGHSEITIDGNEKGHLTVALDTHKFIEGYFSVKVPIEDIPKVNGDISIEYSPDFYRGSYSLVIDEEKKSSVDMSLDLKKKVEGSFRMDMESTSYTADMTLTQNPVKFSGNSDVIIDNERKAGFVSNLDVENGILASLKLSLPMKNFSKIEADFSLKEESSHFNLIGLLKKNNKEIINLGGKFTYLNKISGDFSLMSMGFHPLSVSFDVEGSITDFLFTGSFTHNGEQLLTSAGKFSLSEKSLMTHGSMSVNKHSFVYKMETSANLFNSHVELSDTSMRYAVDAMLSNLDGTEASVSLIIPEREPVKASFSHSWKGRKVQTIALLKMNATSIYQCSMTLTWQGALEGDIILKTPHEQFLLTNLKFQHSGNFPLVKSVLELNNNNKKLFRVSADIPHAPSTNGEISIETAMKGLENIDLTFYHEGGIENFKTGGKIIYAPGEAIQFDLEHMWIGNMLNSRVSFMSKFTDRILMTTYHSGTPTDFTCKCALYMGKDNKIEADTAFKTGLTSLDFSSTVSTTMSGETSIQKSGLKLDGTTDRFKSEMFVESFGKTIRLDSSFQLKPVVEGSLILITPFESYEEMKASFSHSGELNNFLTKCQVQYMPKQTLSAEFELKNNGWRKMDTTVTIKTPFEGMEESIIIFKHTGDKNSFQCDPKLFIGSTELSGTIKASRSPLSLSVTAKTPFVGFESLGFDSSVQFDKRGRYGTQIESNWGPFNKIIFDGSLTSMSNTLQGSASLTTPFKQFSRAAIEFSHKELPTKYTESLLASFNGESLLDLDIDFNPFGDKKDFVANIRAPQPMNLEVSGDFTLMCVDMDATLNMGQSNTQMKLESGYDLRFSTKTADFKLSRQGHAITYKGEFSLTKSKSDLSWGMSSAEKTGFDLNINKNDAALKIVVPGKHARVLELNGLYNRKMAAANFFWDAEVDRTKMFGIKTVFTGRSNQLKGAVSVMVPGLQKTVEVESDMSVHMGRVVFDGKLSFSFSRDERKKIVLTSRVEDVSTGPNSMNYSVTVGLSQPYTTVGVRMYSHLGKSNSRYSAAMRMEYMTAKQQIKTFSIGGEVDSHTKSMQFEMVNPLKTISISGNARINEEFRVTLVNKYDQKTPLNTEFTFNPKLRFIDFHANYDLEEPLNEFHMHAEYVNSSAVKAEMYRTIDNNKITDVLATTRLNNSHLLHSRLHWRPHILDDLQVYYMKKMAGYKDRMKKTAFTLGEDLIEEIYDKSSMIRQMIEEEVGNRNMRIVEEAFMPVKYHIVANVNRLIQMIQTTANSSWNNYNTVMQKYQMLTQRARAAMIAMESPIMMPLPIEKPFDYAMEMVKLPGKHLPSQSMEIMKNVGYILPKPVNSQIATVNKIWELESNYKTTIETVLKIIEKEMMKDLLKLKRFVMTATLSPVTIYDPEHGEIQAEFFLPIPLKSLDTLPVIDLYKYYDMIKAQTKKISNNIPDMSGEWMPPFTGTATISQGRLITTFDGLTYDLESDCTFILTKDYHNGNFTIIRSNSEDPSVIILSQSKPIEMKLSGEVLLDGKPAELPMTNGIVKITRLGNMVTAEGRDFNLVFDLETDHLTVNINGWYYGKTGGLLGVYDNEPSNDLMTSFNKVITVNNRFAKTWEVGTATCR